MYINEANMPQFSLGYIQTDGKNNSHSCKNCQLSSLQLQTVELFLQFSLFFLYPCSLVTEDLNRQEFSPCRLWIVVGMQSFCGKL